MKGILWSLLLWIAGFCIGIIFMIYRCGYILNSKQRRVDKFYSYFSLLDQWLLCKERNYKFTDFFSKNNIKSVAIYGMGKIGKHLKYELEKDGIKIDYVIDEVDSVIYDKAHYTLQDNLPLTDAVIVTPIYEFEEIRCKILNNNKNLNVISLDKIIYCPDKEVQ